MGQVIKIDDFKQELKRLSSLKNSIPEQYKSIGEALSICEISTIKVGVPWLPPSKAPSKAVNKAVNKESKEINKKFFYPLEDFIKASLSAVQTETLISYCEDLSSLGSEDNDSLHIPNLKPHQRYYFCFVVIVVLFSSSTFISLLLNSSISAALAVSVITAIPAGLLAIFPCLEIQRRVSFYILLSREISRRRGSDSTGSIGIIPQGT